MCHASFVQSPSSQRYQPSPPSTPHSTTPHRLPSSLHATASPLGSPAATARLHGQPSGQPSYNTTSSPRLGSMLLPANGTAGAAAAAAAVGATAAEGMAAAVAAAADVVVATAAAVGGLAGSGGSGVFSSLLGGGGNAGGFLTPLGPPVSPLNDILEIRTDLQPHRMISSPYRPPQVRTLENGGSICQFKKDIMRQVPL